MCSLQCPAKWYTRYISEVEGWDSFDAQNRVHCSLHPFPVPSEHAKVRTKLAEQNTEETCTMRSPDLSALQVSIVAKESGESGSTYANDIATTMKALPNHVVSLYIVESRA